MNFTRYVFIRNGSNGSALYHYSIICWSCICQDLSGTTNYLVFAFLQAIQFVVGVYVLLSGVRLILGEIVPAFRGIAMKLVPNAIPALDCPVLFPYSPNAVILGFITTTIGTIIAMFILPVLD